MIHTVNDFFNKAATDIRAAYFADVVHGLTENKSYYTAIYTIECFSNGCLTYRKLIGRLAKSCKDSTANIHEIVSKYIVSFGTSYNYKPSTKNLETVKESLYKLFHDYRIENINESTFLNKITTLCKSRGNKSYWWRFFKSDTGANDPQRLAMSLNSPKNRPYMIECIDICLETKELTVLHS